MVGLPQDAAVLLFVGRIQPLKAPDVLLRAAAAMIERDPAQRSKLVVAIVGGPSGSGLAEPTHLHRLARRLGIADVVRFVKPVDQDRLADWYRAADLCVVPSYSESFGLVAIEAQACGTPVVAASVGGLATAVADGRSGLLVAGHDPDDYATAISRLLDAPRLLGSFGEHAVRHAERFGWGVTAAATAEVYSSSIEALRMSRFGELCAGQ
jgi:D-inositol-3-phosphate glycosyltransferase